MPVQLTPLTVSALGLEIQWALVGAQICPSEGQTKANFFFFCLQILALTSFCFVLFIVCAAERLEVPKHSFSPQLPEVRSLTFELDFAGVFWLVLWSCLSVIMLCLHAV